MTIKKGTIYGKSQYMKCYGCDKFQMTNSKGYCEPCWVKINRLPKSIEKAEKVLQKLKEKRQMILDKKPLYKPIRMEDIA